VDYRETGFMSVRTTSGGRPSTVMSIRFKAKNLSSRSLNCGPYSQRKREAGEYSKTFLCLNGGKLFTHKILIEKCIVLEGYRTVYQVEGRHAITPVFIQAYFIAKSLIGEMLKSELRMCPGLPTADITIAVLCKFRHG
jgi:hypothetical protein